MSFCFLSVIQYICRMKELIILSRDECYETFFKKQKTGRKFDETTNFHPVLHSAS